MHVISSIVGNVFYVATFVCALVGLLMIWKQVTDVRAADAERSAMIAQSLASGAYPPSAVTIPVRDPEEDIRKWQDRAEVAELKVDELQDELAIIQRRVRDLQEEVRFDKEEIDRAIAHAADIAAHDYGGALADAAEEAERHWSAGLNQVERDVAWDKHWQNFDAPVRAIIEEQVNWWRSIRRQ